MTTEAVKNYKIAIHEITEGTDDWPKIDTIYGETEQECLDKAQYEYGNTERYHYTNPIEIDWQDR